MINIVKLNQIGTSGTIPIMNITFAFDNKSELPRYGLYELGEKRYLIANDSIAINVADKTIYKYFDGIWKKTTEKAPDKIDTSITNNGNCTLPNNTVTGIINADINVSGGDTPTPPTPPTPTPTDSNKPVKFYDYDGTIVNSYTKDEFLALSAMPTNPTHEGLTSQGWNWSLEDAKEYVTTYEALNIGQMYITDNGKTRLYITLSEGRTSPTLQLYLNVNSELDIDWGDDGLHSTFTSYGYKSERHEYATSGDYVISITVNSGSFVLQSSSTNVSSILWNETNSSSSPDIAYTNAIKKIEIGTGVRKISDHAFSSCYSLSSITIPDTITNISQYAFQNCYSLTSITIPKTVTNISQYAFQNCYSLSSITIPDSVTIISQYAFANCKSLSSINIPDKVTIIENNTFYTCSTLSSIVIPDGVTSIGDSAFEFCQSLASINIPDGVTNIGTSAFQHCNPLTSITIPDGVTTISSYAFGDCKSLTSITIPDGVTSIGSNAFNSCPALSSITIPDGVTSISDHAFSSCLALSSITIPDGVTSIGDYAFSSCYSLSSITIPDRVTKINKYSFQACYSLSSITIPDEVTIIGNGAFQYCYSLQSITIGSKVTSIATQAFDYCRYLESIKFTSTTPPTVANKNAWNTVPTTCKIYVPSGSLSAYTSATNYPNPNTYTYIEY